MPINWNNKEALVHLLVCMYPDYKFDYRQIAKRWTEFYGEGVSYHSVEGFFRKIRKEWKELEEVHPKSDVSAPPTRGVSTARQRTPKKSDKAIGTDDVRSGRVQKNKSPSRHSQRYTGAVKEESFTSTSVLTPSSMSAMSEQAEDAPYTDDFAVFDFSTPKAPVFHTTDGQYDMREYDVDGF